MSCFNTLNDKFHFGKYKGKSIGEVLQYDPGYITWCNNNVDPERCYFTEDLLHQISESFPDFPLDGDFLEQWSLNDCYLEELHDYEIEEAIQRQEAEEAEANDPYKGIDWAEEEWDALTDGQYGPYPGGDIDYDVFGF